MIVYAPLFMHVGSLLLESDARQERAKQDRIKEHDRDIRDIRLAHTQSSAVSEHANETGHFPLWNQVKFIDRDPHRYTRRVKEAIQIKLHPNNINRDSDMTC